MADQFGVELQELAKIQTDFQRINDEMAQLSQKVGAIRAAVQQAAATDVSAGGMLGVVNFFAVAVKVAAKVHEIGERAEALEQTKKQLTEAIGEDAQKLQQVIKAYQDAEQQAQGGLDKITDGGAQTPAPPGKSPSTGLDSAGGGGGGGGGNDTSGNDGSGITQRPGGLHDGPSIKDKSDGKWETKFINGDDWEDWNGHKKTHPVNGKGVGPKDQPIIDGVSDERRAMIDRAMERVNRKLGYSQGAVTNGYRVDCSGFVSAAWGLDGPGTTTGPLIKDHGPFAHHIGQSELQPGDALVVDNSKEQHVMLFGGWADADHSRLIILEDSGSNGCISHNVPVSYISEYTPIRKNGM